MQISDLQNSDARNETRTVASEFGRWATIDLAGPNSSIFPENPMLTRPCAGDQVDNPSHARPHMSPARPVPHASAPGSLPEASKCPGSPVFIGPSPNLPAQSRIFPPVQYHASGHRRHADSWQCTDPEKTRAKRAQPEASDSAHALDPALKALIRPFPAEPDSGLPDPIPPQLLGVLIQLDVSTRCRKDAINATRRSARFGDLSAGRLTPVQVHQGKMKRCRPGGGQEQILIIIMRIILNIS